MVTDKKALRWGLIAVAFFAWTLGETLWGIWPFLMKKTPEDSQLIINIYHMANVCLTANICISSFSGRKIIKISQYFFDTLMVLLVCVGFEYYFVFSHDLDSILRFCTDDLNTFFDICLDIISLVLIVSNILDAKKGTANASIAFIAISYIAFCFADGFSMYRLVNGEYSTNDISDLFYIAVPCLLGIGCILNDPSNSWTEKANLRNEIGRSSTWKGTAIIVLPFLACILRDGNTSCVVFFLVVLSAYQTTALLLKTIEDKTNKTMHLEKEISDRIAELQHANDNYRNLAMTDRLTGLYNRTHFLQLLDSSVQGWTGEKMSPCLVILDINHFKSINGTYGHATGDEALNNISEILRNFCGDRCAIARLGGDEFAILFRNDPLEEIRKTLWLVRDALRTPVKAGRFMLRLSASFGAASYPKDAPNSRELMRAADLALLRAKGNKLQPIEYFSADLSREIERKQHIEMALKLASIPDEFEVYYQAQYTIDGSTLIGMEALLRWTSPHIGRIGPNEFIPIAEETGMIIPISDWMMKNAFSRIRDWNEAIGKELVMSVNVSPAQLDDARFLSHLWHRIEAANIPTSWVKLEITESVAMKTEDRICSMLAEIKAMGIKIAIDDFGTGYSSLYYLKKYNVDYLKIDKKLLDEITENDTDLRLASAIIAMANALEIKTIAEGVENGIQHAILKDLGCNEIQGYLFGKPATAERFEIEHITNTAVS